jgi:hypothetical protein
MSAMTTRGSLLILVVMLLGSCAQPSQSSDSSATGSASASTAAASSAPESAAETASPSTTPRPESPTPSSATVVRIVSVECLTGLTLSIHFEIRSDAGIESYGLWSTWGGGGDFNEDLTAPLPTQIDRTVEFTHAIVDPVPSRVHQFGLVAQLIGVADPIITYEVEPDNRCPGH